jgi:hypothetical protein
MSPDRFTMSWTVIAQKASAQSGPAKYKVTAFHKEDPSALSSEIEINRDEIIEDFQRLLPFISGIRFRALKLKFENNDPSVVEKSKQHITQDPLTQNAYEIVTEKDDKSGYEWVNVKDSTAIQLAGKIC